MKILLLSCLLLSYNSFAKNIIEAIDSPYLKYKSTKDLEIKEVSKNIWKIIQTHTPMFAHLLFELDEKLFVETYEGKDFLDAKIKSYKNLQYSLKEKNYIFQTPVLKDWAGLNHPPLLELKRPIEFYYNIQDSNDDHFTAEFHYNIDDISASELTRDNNFEYYQDDKVFDVLFQTLEKAKDEIWGSSLLLTCDKPSEQLREILIKKAKQGVKVHLILDKNMQMMQNGNCIKDLQGQGVNVLLVPGLFLKGSGFHFKNWIVDRSESIMMGANLVDSQILSNGFNYLYHDSGVWMQGPAVVDMISSQLYFWKNYRESDYIQKVESQMEIIKENQRDKKLRGSENYKYWKKNDIETCRVVWQSPNKNKFVVSKVIAEYLQNSSQNIMTTNIRLQNLSNNNKWHNKIIDIVKNKAKNGVQVDIITNFQYHAFSPYYAENSGLTPEEKMNFINRILLTRFNLLTKIAVKNSVAFQTEFQGNNLFRLWSYLGFSHNKTISIDKKISIVGSYNPMHVRSNKDMEISLICNNKKLAEDLHHSYVRDLVNSFPIPLDSQVVK